MSLPDFTTTLRSRPWNHVGHRVLRPFGTPPQSEEFCLPCGVYVAISEDFRFEGTVYGSKTWCRRCGAVIRYGVYNQHLDPAVGQRALAWATSREEPA